MGQRGIPVQSQSQRMRARELVTVTTCTVLTRRTLRLTLTWRLVRPLQTLGAGGTTSTSPLLHLRESHPDSENCCRKKRVCLQHLLQTLRGMQKQRVLQMNAVIVGKYFLSPTGSRDTSGKFMIKKSSTNVRIVTKHSFK